MAQWIFSGSTGSNWWQCRLVVALASQNITNNTSTLNFTFQVCRTNYENYGISDSGTTYSISTSDGGTGNLSFNCQIAAGTAGNGSWKNIGSTWSKTINHNANGTKTISCSSSWTLPVASPKWASVGTSWIDLPTIPRASSVSGGTGNIGSATTINISRASSSFTHKLHYAFGSIGKTQIATGVGSSYSWTIPTSLYAQIPNATSGKGTIYCDTYSGSTLVGSTTCSFTATVTGSAPTVTANIYDSNSVTTSLTGNNKILVKGYSNAYVSITATAKNSATIKSVAVSCGDGQVGASLTQTLKNVASGNFDVRCSDSRGLSASSSHSLSLLAYLPVGFKNLEIERTSSTSTTAKLKAMLGQFWNANFGSVTNTLEVTYQSALVGSSTWSAVQTLTPTKSGDSFSLSNITLSGVFDLNKSYQFKFTVKDKLTTSTITRFVTVGTPIMDIGKNDININGDMNISGKLNASSIGLKSEYSDGQGYYHFANGHLITTNIPKTTNVMTELYITGNGYSATETINTTINCYVYNSSDIIQRSNTTNGYPLSVDIFFNSNNFLCFWFKQPGNYMTFRFRLCTSTGISKPTYVCTNEAKPSTITNNYTPQYKAPSGIVASGENPNGAWIRYGDGTQICTKEIKWETPINTAWLNIYGSGYISIGNWAIDFLSGTKIHVFPAVANLSGGSSAFTGAVRGVTQTSAGSIELYRGAGIASPINLYLKVMAIGRWRG